MTAESPILSELKKMVGREMRITSPDEIGKAGIRSFAQAQGDMNPLYYDEEYASGTRYGGIIAPPTLVCETLQYMVGEVDETGGAAGRFGLPVGMEIRAANDYEFYQPCGLTTCSRLTGRSQMCVKRRVVRGRCIFWNMT